MFLTRNRGWAEGSVAGSEVSVTRRVATLALLAMTSSVAGCSARTDEPVAVPVTLAGHVTDVGVAPEQGGPGHVVLVGTKLFIWTMGSSSCPVTTKSVVADGETLRLTLVGVRADTICTSDLRTNATAWSAEELPAAEQALAAIQKVRVATWDREEKRAVPSTVDWTFMRLA